MSLVDRYWEWRRRRALASPLRAREHACELELVAEVVMKRRGVSQYRSSRERASSTGQVTATRDFREQGPVRNAAEDDQTVSDLAGYSKLLVAVDGSEGDRKVGEHAVHLAARLSAELFVLGVVNKRLASGRYVCRANAIAELRRESEASVEDVKQLADEIGVAHEESLVLGRPWEAVVRTAWQVGADCIVVGSPDVSAVDLILDRAIGGVYEKVLRRTKCPVLSVRY